MAYSTITTAIDNGVARISLNRPERRNALDVVLIQELTDAFTTVNRNTQSRIVVLTGAGSSFCAGMDLNYLQEISKHGQAENLEDARALMKLLQLIYSLKKPVIAMVNGPALGGGCGLAAACDFVFAAKKGAKMGAPEVRLGFLPAVILVYLVKRMGEGPAREFVLRGDVLDAVEAQARGLVTEAVEDDQLESTVMAFASRLKRSASPTAIALTKELFSRFDEMDVKNATEYAANLNALIRKTDDFKRGIESFLKKEPLEW